MLRPSESSTNRMARLVMRTQAVPIPARTNGSTASATAISAIPIQAPRGCFFGSSSLCMGFLCAGADALAEEARRPEEEHGDQDEEGEHVLVVAAEQREVGVVDAALGDRVGPRRQLAQVGEIADVAGAQGLDEAEQ